MKVVGQNFWYLISGDESFYIDIVEPLGHEAQKHNDKFVEKKNEILNNFTQDFLNEFCNDGVIDWEKIVKYNSGNLDLDQFMG